MNWLIFLSLSYHEHIFEAKMEAEVRLLEVNCTYFVAKMEAEVRRLEVNCTYFVAKIKFNSLIILKFI